MLPTKPNLAELWVSWKPIRIAEKGFILYGKLQGASRERSHFKTKNFGGKLGKMK